MIRGLPQFSDTRKYCIFKILAMPFHGNFSFHSAAARLATLSHQCTFISPPFCLVASTLLQFANKMRRQRWLSIHFTLYCWNRDFSTTSNDVQHCTDSASLYAHEQVLEICGTKFVKMEVQIVKKCCQESDWRYLIYKRTVNTMNCYYFNFKKGKIPRFNSNAIFSLC